MFLFAFASLSPAILIVAAAVFGGIWPLIALAAVTAVVASLDHLVARDSPTVPDAAGPAATALCATLGLTHLALIPIAILYLAADEPTVANKIAVFIAAGLYLGQVGNANAHELIHKANRTLHRLGAAVYVALLFGHHVSAHLHVHHRLAATRDDPNTSRLGESYYRFFARAWIGSFRAGLTAEATRLRRIGRPSWRNPYVFYIGGAAILLAAAAALGGWVALLWYLALAGLAQHQLMLCDYVQHYGLLRRTDAGTGKPEPCGTAHSWNSPHWFSSAFMLNAPRHSDHHAHPGRSYPALKLPADAPMLPRSLPVMACLALVPGAWRRVMDPRALAWQKAP